jgi:4-diphosphocytidyl-2-C-methyl-D-erythritol kinase
MRIDAPAKVNIFLKITGYKEGYHTLLSRFVQIPHLYDTLTFIPAHRSENFRIEGCGDVAVKNNTVYLAYQALYEHTASTQLRDFFRTHTVRIEKRIPSGAGLGGGSSDAAAFLRLANEVCELKLDIDTLAKIGAKTGADVPFFVYDYPSANVTGFGEIIEPFDEIPPKLEIRTPPIHCNTAEVYKIFKTHFLDEIDTASFQGWEKEKSETLLKRINDAQRLNDLYRAALLRYPELADTTYAKEGWFFSGSGSGFFKVKA